MLHSLVVLLRGKVHGEDEVEIIVGDVAGVAGQHGAGPGAVEPDLLHLDGVLLQLGPD